MERNSKASYLGETTKADGTESRPEACRGVERELRVLVFPLDMTDLEEGS